MNNEQKMTKACAARLTTQLLEGIEEEFGHPFDSLIVHGLRRHFEGLILNLHLNVENDRITHDGLVRTAMENLRQQVAAQEKAAKKNIKLCETSNAK